MEKNRYESYNPDINLTYGETDDGANLTYGDTESHQQENRPAQPRTSSPAKKPKKPSAARTTTKKKQPKEVNLMENLSSMSASVKSFITDPRTRAMIGITALLFGSYLLIAFISFLTAGFHDQSSVENVPIGKSGAVANLAGEGGARISEMLINNSFGLASIVIIIWLFGIALKQFGIFRFKTVNFTIKCIVALVTCSLIVGLLTIGFESHYLLGGAHGYYINDTIIKFLGWYGAALLCILLLVLFFLICLYDIYKYFKKLYIRRRDRIAELRRKDEEEAELRRQIAELQALEEERENENLSEVERLQALQDCSMTFMGENPEGDEPQKHEGEKSYDPAESFDENPEEEKHLQERQPDDLPEESASSQIEIEGEESVMTVTVNEISSAGSAPLQPVNQAAEGEYDPRAELSKYQFPSSDLLQKGSVRITVDQDEQLANQERIRSTLADFGITITDISATVGPTVTLYEIKLDSGVRINKVRNLGDDIALSLAARGVRIIAPIPGRGTVGIEVANQDPQTVDMRTIIESKKFHECKYELPIALGSTIDNKVYIADLTRMPHLLVAGATGQGKSVGLNAIIASLLYRKHPSELKFVLVDPKMVEFSLYRVIERHYLAKLADEEDAVITDPAKVVTTLSSLCVEMDERYKLLRAAGVRDVVEYNDKFRKRVLNPEKGHRFMPYIVVIVDEFADLIMTAGKEVETPIARLAQKARAIGIHVILATQRPTTNIITGVIKANFPARIAFKVSSGVDSKTILDATGAQQLIGRGDMLISDNSEIERVQCAFIRTPEVTAICEHIASQPGYPHALYLPDPPASSEDSGSANGNNFADRDPMFEEVGRYVVGSNTASTSSIQRRYAMGYNRAGKIMDQLEAAGVVGPAQGGKPRQVLMDMIAFDQMMSSL